MEIPLLKDVVVILLLAMGVVFVSHRLRIPMVVGLLLTGVLAGPHALGLVKALHAVEQLAKIGVILLLFTIGIEFSLRKLFHIKLLVLVGGSMQVLLTVAAVAAGLYYGLNWAPGPAFFMGFLISLSSTAIVLKVLQDRAELESPQGRLSLGILIFQDVIVVLFIILTPFLAGAGGSPDSPPVLRLALTGGALLLFVFLGARHVVPAILHQAVRTRSRELFLLTVAGICFAVALAAAELSLALGAFLAGLTISESEYSHDAFELVRPFRDIFTAFFFVSIGMLLDTAFILQQPLLVLGVTAAVLVGKSAIVSLTGLVLGFPLRTALIGGLGLCQVGEFAFILATVGSEHSLLSPGAEQLFLAVSVLTMGVTSFLIAGAPTIADGICRLPLPDRLVQGLRSQIDLQTLTKDAPRDHLLIIGFGINGRNVARAAKHAGIACIIIENNADTVKEERKLGQHILYGDASREAVLERSGVSGARTIVIAVPDAATTRRVTALARKMNPAAHIIARTRYQGEVGALHDLGADHVIPEEFETSVAIFSHVLRKYLVPPDEISRLVAELRGDDYQVLREASVEGGLTAADLHPELRDMEIAAVKLQPGSPLAGKSLADADFRKRTGLTVLALRRRGALVTKLNASLQLQEGDLLFVIGSPLQVVRAAELLS